MAASTCALSVKVAAAPASLASSRSAANGTPVGVAFPGNVVASKATSVSCRASAEEKDVTSRRSALALLAGLAAVGLKAAPANAAYGEAANVFGTPKTDTGFTTYSGEGFVVRIPSKWNPSKETEFPGQVLRYEDNFDQLSNLSVSIVESPVNTIKDFGSPEKFLEKNSYLLGKQSYTGETASEGGFERNAAAAANIFTAAEKEINDGTEGGRHQNIVAAVDKGKLFIFKAQAGDKRWFKGTQKFVEGAAESFKLA